ncbi:MAG: hypothetical protein JWL73_2319, partial [Actinomycetia bacterium]|nr:hypothetical protein [Actinomycetes bacterium]
ASGATTSRRSRYSPSKQWWIALGVIVALGLLVRLLHLHAVWGDKLSGDAFYYHGQAKLIADGRGFLDPYTLAYHQGPRQVATHPPLFSLVLAAADVVGLRSADTHRVVCSFLGAGTVLLVGLLGRQLGGRRVGLIAAACAAFYPGLWASDNQVLSESLYGLLIAGVLLLAYAFWRRPTYVTAAGLGALCMLAALTRGEAVLLFPLLLLPLLVMVRRVGKPQVLRLGGVAFLVAALLLAPWAIRNALTFENPVVISNNQGQTFMYANCNTTYGTGNAQFGSWAFYACNGHNYKPVREESVADKQMRQIAWRYVRNHLGQLPVVTLGRLGRVWNLWAPVQNLKLEKLEGRSHSIGWMTLVSFYVLSGFGIYGVVVLRRRRTWPVWPLVSMFAMVSVTVVIFYATFRFRVPAEVALMVLAALGVDQLLRRRWPVGDDAETVPAVVDPGPDGGRSRA